MTFEQVVTFLKGRRHGVVGSIAADGSPQSAVVGIATTDAGEIVFDTTLDTRKAQNLARDPRVSLTVWEGEQTVQLEGRANRPQGTERERLLEVYLRAFPDGRARLEWPGITHVRITPRWVRWSDFSTSPAPTIVSIDRQ